MLCYRDEGEPPRLKCASIRLGRQVLLLDLLMAAARPIASCSEGIVFINMPTGVGLECVVNRRVYCIRTTPLPKTLKPFSLIFLHALTYDFTGRSTETPPLAFPTVFGGRQGVFD